MKNWTACSNSPLRGLLNSSILKGLAAKKTKALWQALGIQSPEDLLKACEQNLLIDVKGFGKKTQDNIIELIHFYFENKNSYLYAEAEAEWYEILKHLENHKSVKRIAITGAMRRKVPIIRQIDILVQMQADQNLEDAIKEAAESILVSDEGYKTEYLNIPVYFYQVYQDNEWIAQLDDYHRK